MKLLLSTSVQDKSAEGGIRVRKTSHKFRKAIAFVTTFRLVSRLGR